MYICHVGEKEVEVGGRSVDACHTTVLSKAHLATSIASVKSGGRRYIHSGTATRALGGPAGDPAIWVLGSHKPYFYRRLTRPLFLRSSCTTPAV